MREILAILGEMGVCVLGMGTDGDGKFPALLGPVWEALGKQELWVF
jgi:hypothetical protein